MQREREPSSFFALATLMLLLEEIKYRICKGKRKGRRRSRRILRLDFFWTQDGLYLFWPRSSAARAMHVCQCCCCFFGQSKKSTRVLGRHHHLQLVCVLVLHTHSFSSAALLQREGEIEIKSCVPLLFPRERRAGLTTESHKNGDRVGVCLVYMLHKSPTLRVATTHYSYVRDAQQPSCTRFSPCFLLDPRKK